MSEGTNYVDRLMNLESLRKSLVRQEDTIIFNLIERSKYPMNSPLYDHRTMPPHKFSASLFQFFIKESEALQSKVLFLVFLFNLHKPFDIYVFISYLFITITIVTGNFGM